MCSIIWIRWCSSLRFRDRGSTRSSARASAARKRKRYSIKCGPTQARWVAQEQVALSTVPVWEDNRIGPRHLVLRVYAVPAGGSYVVMPGGLTRISSSLDNMVVSMQSGGGSKDTWVLGRRARAAVHAAASRDPSAGSQPRHLRPAPAASPTIFSGWAVTPTGWNRCCG